MREIGIDRLPGMSRIVRSRHLRDIRAIIF